VVERRGKMVKQFSRRGRVVDLYDVVERREDVAEKCCRTW